MASTKPTPIRIPEELKTLVNDSLREGEFFADFVRDAIRRELKRRGKKTKSVPDVQRGRPTGDTEDS